MQYASASVFDQQYPFESGLVNIAGYFNEFALSIESRPTLKVKPESLDFKNDPKASEDEFYMENLGISVDQLIELKRLTSIDELTCEGELKPFSIKASEFQSDSEKSIPENSLISLRGETKKKFKTKNPEFALKYKESFIFPYHSLKNHMFDLNSFDFKTVIVSVRIYSPFISQKNAHFKVKLLQEIYLLGNQYLSDLKDQIKCNLDRMNLKDVSDNCFLKNLESKSLTKGDYASSFIFIENTFYSDDRALEMFDLSKATREWLETRKLGPFNVCTMREKPISEIPLKTGHPYVYQHQGNCEHIIIFSDLRLLSAADDLKSRSYPRVNAIGHSYAKHCMMCSTGYAKWLVKENKRLTHDKTFLCNRCYKSYNYINGGKVGQFKAYEYVDPVALL